MSTTTGTSLGVPGGGDRATEGVTAEVSRYVASVRAALADRPDDEVDDLTGGMDADLTELLAERGGSLEAALGTPYAYSVELRSAAGVPPAPSEASSVRTIDLRAGWTLMTTGVVTVRDRHPWLASTWAFLVSLRPVWWLLRGLALGALLFGLTGNGNPPSLVPTPGFSFAPSLQAFVTTGVTVVLSVLYGRGLGPAHRFRGAVGAVLGVVAVVGLLSYPVIAREVDYVDTSRPPADELSFAGQPVDNIYVYDRDGRRLEDVRLFDAQGRSLVLQRTSDPASTNATLPGISDVYGQWWTNVYPRPWTVGGAPYARNPQADPSSPLYVGAQAWSPPPSVAPLVADPTAGPSATTAGPSATTAGPSATTAGPSATTAGSARPSPSPSPSASTTSVPPPTAP